MARAAVSSRQGGAVWRRFYATQNPKHKVPASSSSKTQTESGFPVFSTNWGFPKRLFFCQNPRFYSQTSTNTTDSEESSVGFVENGDTQLESSEIHGVSEQGLVGIDENRDTQLDSFVPGMGMRFLGSQTNLVMPSLIVLPLGRKMGMKRRRFTRLMRSNCRMCCLYCRIVLMGL